MRGCLSLFAPPADHGGQNRHEDHGQYEHFDVLVDAGNIRAQEIPGEQHAPYPENSSEHADNYEMSIWHLSDTRDNRRKRANYRNELRHHNRFSPVTLIKLLCSEHILLAEEERVFTGEDLWSRHVTDEISKRIAGRGCDVEQKTQNVNIQHSSR